MKKMGGGVEKKFDRNGGDHVQNTPRRALYTIVAVAVQRHWAVQHRWVLATEHGRDLRERRTEYVPCRPFRLWCGTSVHIE